MPFVHFTSHLHRFFPGLRDGEVPGATVAELVKNLEARHSGIARYLTDEHGALRTHVHIFIREELILDRAGLSDKLCPDDRVHVLQALSGG
jgi:sulfur-carrier protein